VTAVADVSEIAVLFVLQRAHDHARHAEATLELEAADPRIADLVTQARKLRKAIALRSIELVEPGVVPIA
jgi:hypothetical protein